MPAERTGHLTIPGRDEGPPWLGRTWRVDVNWPKQPVEAMRNEGVKPLEIYSSLPAIPSHYHFKPPSSFQGTTILLLSPRLYTVLRMPWKRAAVKATSSLPKTSKEVEVGILCYPCTLLGQPGKAKGAMETILVV